MFDWYQNELRHQEATQRRNTNMLGRQLFQRAAQQHCIAIHPDRSIEILNLNAAVQHFSHHPDLSGHIPEMANGLYRHDKDLLERGLTMAYREVLQG